MITPFVAEAVALYISAPFVNTITSLNSMGVANVIVTVKTLPEEVTWRNVPQAHYMIPSETPTSYYGCIRSVGHVVATLS